MRKLIVTEWMTLDGVVQAPGDPDEDKAAGFLHGGWHLPYFDDISREWVIQNLTEAGGFLLGRRTYESFAPHWPNAPADEQVIAEPLNSQPKYVASTTLSEPTRMAEFVAAQGRYRSGGRRAQATRRRRPPRYRQLRAGQDADCQGSCRRVQADA